MGVVGGDDVCFGRKLNSSGPRARQRMGPVNTTRLIEMFSLIKYFYCTSVHRLQERGGRIFAPEVLTFGVNQDRPRTSPPITV